MNRTFRRVLWIALPVLVAAAVAWWLPAIAGWAAVLTLERRGFAPSSLRVETITPWRLVLRDISVDGGRFAARSLTLAYAPSELMNSHLRLLDIEAPTFDIGDRPPAPSPRPDSPASDDAGPATTEFPRIDRLTVRDGTGLVRLTGGLINVAFGGELSLADGNVEGSIGIDATGAGLLASAKWKGSLPLKNPVAWRGEGKITADAKNLQVPMIKGSIDGTARTTLSGTAEGFGFDIAASGGVGVSRGKFAAQGRFDAASDGSVGQNFKIPLIEAQVENLDLNGMRLQVSASLTDSIGPIAVAGGKFNLSADAQQQDANAPMASGSVTGRGEWRLDGLSLSFDITAFDAKAAGAHAGLESRLFNDVAIRLSPRTDPPQQINLVFGSGGGMTLAPELEFVVTPLRLLPDGQNLELDFRPLKIGGYLSLSGGDSRATISTGLDGAARMTSQIVSAGKGWTVEGSLAANDGRPLGIFAATVRPAAPWRATLEISDLKFGEGAVAWSEAFGPLVDLRSVTGSLTATADIAPDDAGIAGKVRINARDFSFAWADTKFQGLGIDVSLDRVWPPHSTVSQSVNFSSIGAATPFESGALTFGFPGDGTMVLSGIDIGFGGGKIRGNDTIIHLDGAPSDAKLDVIGVDLGKLLASTTLQGLDGTGIIGGSLPMHIEGGRIEVREGVLSARSGIIRYRPETPSAALAAGGAIVGQALANFQYDELKAALNGDVMEDLQIVVGLKGKNPDVMKGYPVEFNINLEGPLGRIATSSMAAFRIPETIRDRIHQLPVNDGEAAKPP